MSEQLDTSLDRVRLIAELDRVRSENARLRRLLQLRPGDDIAPGTSQTGMFDAPPGHVDNASSPERKLAFFRSFFVARTDVYALHWENRRSGRGGWAPAVRGGWRKGRRARRLPAVDR